MRLNSAPIDLTKLKCAIRRTLIAACMLVLPAALAAQVVSYAGQQETLPVASGLTQPAAVTFDGLAFYVINRHASNVIEYSSSLSPSAITVALSDPYAMAEDSSGNLYIADYGNNHVVKVAAVNRAVTTVGTGLSHPMGVAVDSSNNLYIADSSNGRVLKIAASNGAQTVISAGTFTTPVGLAIDSSNNLYVSDTGSQKVFKVAFTGAQVAVSTLLTGLTNDPTAVAVDAVGDVFLSGGSDDTVMMYQVPAQLGASGTIRQLGTGLSSPAGILETGGILLVADQGAPAIDSINFDSVNMGSANLCPLTGTQTSPCSQSVTLNFNVAAGASLASLSSRVVTQGAASLDFIATNSSCTGALTGPTSCSVTVNFKPLAPGARLGAVDVSGTVTSAANAPFLATVPLYGQASGSLVGFDAGVINPLPLTLAWSALLSGAVADGVGNLYFVDNGTCVVDKFTVATAVTTTVAGSGTCAATASGAGGPATSAVLKDPWRLALNGRGDLYITDDLANVIWKVDAVTQIITAAAGIPGTPGYSADGTVAAGSSLDRPYALAIDGAGDVYFTDYAAQVVRKIDATTGVLSTVAGNHNAGQGYSGDGGPATLAMLDNPVGLALDSNDLYIVDFNNDVIRKVASDTGIITTFAGVAATPGYTGDGGAAASAELSSPLGVAVDPAGNVYIADTNNYVARKVSASTGFISTVSGVFNGGLATGTKLDTGDGGAANLAGLSDVEDVTLDGSGNLYLVDTTNKAIRKITSNSGIVSFGTSNLGVASPSVDVVVTNNGNAALDLSALTAAVNFNLGGADTTCTASFTLAAGAECVLGLEFLPTATGPLAGSFVLTDDAGGNPSAIQMLALHGTGAFVPTQVVLAGVAATINSGGNLGIVQASIESSGGDLVSNSTATVTATLTGPGNYSQAVASAAANGIASLDLSTLAPASAGTYTLTAASAGLSSSSASITVFLVAAKVAVSGLPTTLVVGGNLGAATVSIESAANAVVTTSSASVTATVAGPGGSSQSVTAVAVNGIATLNLSGLAISTAGTYTITTTSPGLKSAIASVSVAALDFTLAVSSAAGSSATSTVAPGAAATYSLTLSPANSSFIEAITMSATGLPAGATASFSPATVTPGSAAASTTLTIQTAAATAAVHSLKRIGNGLGGIAMGLLLLPLAASRRLRKPSAQMPAMALLIGLFSLGAICALSGCGGSNATGTTTPPAQTYTVTVTGTSGAVTHSTTVTLVVQ